MGVMSCLDGDLCFLIGFLVLHMLKGYDSSIVIIAIHADSQPGLESKLQSSNCLSVNTIHLIIADYTLVNRTITHNHYCNAAVAVPMISHNPTQLCVHTKTNDQKKSNH